MERLNRSRLAAGLLLILLGAWFLIVQLVPGLGTWFDRIFAWPTIIIAVGAVFLIIGLLTGAPGLAIPASVIAGVGALLYYQNSTGNWESWAYAWALIPGFVGVGIILAGLLGDPEHRNLAAGGRLILISLILFFIFGSFLGGFPILGPYWPILIIALGILLLARAFSRR